MAKSPNLDPSPGPPKSAFLVIFKRGFIVFRGPCVFFVFLCFSLFVIGFAYFSLVLVVLGFRHINLIHLKTIQATFPGMRSTQLVTDNLGLSYENTQKSKPY